MQKWIITVLIILYVLSPVDLYPGPIDDIMIVVLNATINALVNRKK